MKIIAKRRRREGVTDYRKRKKLLEGELKRIVIRRTNKYIIIQAVSSKRAQDYITHSQNSKNLLKYGWPKEKEGGLKSIPAAYLTGLLFAKTAKEKQIGDFILDSGLFGNTKGSRIYSALKGIIDGGLKVRHGEGMFPKEDKIKNENVKAFFDKVKEKIGR